MRNIIGWLLLMSGLTSRAEGWKELSPYGQNAYVYIQKHWWGSAAPDCPESSKIHIHIKNPGEKIYYGFNWYLPQPPNVATVTIPRILRPDGSVAKQDTITNANLPGWILNYTQAKNGPNVLNPLGYNGFEYTPQVPGDYMLDFDYVDPLMSGGQLNFDITVVDTTVIPWQAIDGRVYSQSWSFQIQSFYGALFTYPDDSVVTSVNFNGLHATNDLFLVMNRNGLDPPPANWITSRMSQVYVPMGVVVADFKTFVNDPDPSVYPTGILGQLTAGSLVVSRACDGTIAISFEVNKAGRVEILVQIDPDPGIQPVDVMISDSAFPGLNTILWNGINGIGQPVSNGTPFFVSVKYLNGLTNLPLNFISESPHGFIVQLHRPQGPSPLLYWDDRLIDPSGYNFTGCLSSMPSSGCHIWTGPPYSYYNTINTWWYTSNGDAVSPTALFKRSFSSFSDTTVCAGETVMWHGQSFSTVGSHTVTFPSLLTGCDSSYTINISNFPTPTIALGADTAICNGQSIVFDAGYCAGCTYQWSNLATGQMNIGASQTLTANAAGVYMAAVTGPNGCTGRDTVTLAVGEPLTISVSITASGNTVCQGSTASFVASPVNPGSSPVYQWKVNGINSGGNSPAFSCTPVNGDQVSCVMTSSIASCIAANPVTSNVIQMTVTPPSQVGVTINAGANNVCFGTMVMFNANAVNPGTSPFYRWKVNGVMSGSNSPVFSYIPQNNDKVWCVLTSSNTFCVSNNPAGSDTISMIVSQPSIISVSISTPSNSVCPGETASFIANPVNAGNNPFYEWQVNGNNLGPNAPIFSYLPTNGDVVSCRVSSSATCVTSSPAVSNSIAMTVSVGLPASVSISYSPAIFCEGNSVAFQAVPVNGGANPSYQWKVNGQNQSGNSSNFSYTPQPGDSVRCVLISNLACVTGSPASSASIILNPAPKPNVSFTTCFDSITTLNAQPFLLKGGLPPGGTFSGPGVNSTTGIFNPAAAGTGMKTISYFYQNFYTCTDQKTRTIRVLPTSNFTCGGIFTDPRDNKGYPTVQIGSQCWMSSNLEFGMTIDEVIPQTDNCIAERYHSSLVPRPSYFYQWDELMNYDSTPGSQGLCPPGWHVPTAAEWDELLTFFNGAGQAGGPMKDTLLPIGFQSLQRGFLYQNNTWAFMSGLQAGSLSWTSTPAGNTRAVARGLNDYNPSVSRYHSLRGNGLGVRCLKD